MNRYGLSIAYNFNKGIARGEVLLGKWQVKVIVTRTRHAVTKLDVSFGLTVFNALNALFLSSIAQPRNSVDGGASVIT